MFWLDPFFYLFSGMVLLDVTVLLIAFLKVKKFYSKAQLFSGKNGGWTMRVPEDGVSNRLRDRLREHQNRPV